MDDPAGEEFVGEVGMKIVKDREVVRGEPIRPSDGVGCSSGSFPHPGPLPGGEGELYADLVPKFSASVFGGFSVLLPLNS